MNQVVWYLGKGDPVEISFSSFFFFFSIFRFIYFSRKTRLDDERRWLCTRGGGRWRARNMRHSNRWNALGLHFPRVWQWQPVESSRDARLRLSSKTNFLARARASLSVNLNPCSVCEISIATRVHNLKIRGWLIKGRIRDRVLTEGCLKGLNACSGEI